jgi:hypothetical protein
LAAFFDEHGLTLKRWQNLQSFANLMISYEQMVEAVKQNLSDFTIFSQAPKAALAGRFVRLPGQGGPPRAHTEKGRPSPAAVQWFLVPDGEKSAADGLRKEP